MLAVASSAPTPHLTLIPVEGDPAPPLLTVIQAPDPSTIRMDLRAAQDRWVARAPLLRIATPSLWEALATAIIRQVVRAQQARRLTAQVRSVAGLQVDTPVGPLRSFPDAASVLAWSDSDFDGMGLRFKRRALRSAATHCLTRDLPWPAEPRELREQLMQIPFVGPWTAGVAAADVTNDFTVYPVGDLAVRHHAGVLAPGTVWAKGDADFAAQWTALTAPRLSDWTILALAGED